MHGRNKILKNKTLQNVGLAVLLLATLAAFVYAFLPKPPATPVGGTTQPAEATPSSAATETATASPTPSATATETEEAEPPVAAFLGDSYVEGIGASSQEDRWSTLVALELGWEEMNHGISGTGYATNAQGPGYVDRLDDVIAENPDVVVVSGGQNNFSTYQFDPQGTLQAISSVYEDLRAELPDAQIIAVGPSTPSAVDQTVFALDAAVQEAAESVDATYVSLLDPDVFTLEMIQPDGVHVDDAGHTAIAERVINAVE